jgi:hypothetical protein
MKKRETINKVYGEWRPVTEADVKLDQYVRYEGANMTFGYDGREVVKGFNSDGTVGTMPVGPHTCYCTNLFCGYWKNIQAFFPCPKPVRKSKYLKLVESILSDVTVISGAVYTCDKHGRLNLTPVQVKEVAQLKKRMV